MLAVEKPAGVSTHQAEPLGQVGLYEHLLAVRGPGAPLALLHRLDKETSGLLWLGKSAAGRRALAGAFERREVDKRYLLLVARDPARPSRLACDDRIAKPKRRGAGAKGEAAETAFERLEAGPRVELFEARPRTGRTHQVRVHAARLGLPLLGDTLYGGQAAARLFLHAARASWPGGPAAEVPLPGSFRRVLAGAAPHDLGVAALAAAEARAPLFDPADTDCWLWIDRHHDGFPDLRVERLGPLALVLRYDERPGPLPDRVVEALHEAAPGLAAVWVQRRPRGAAGGPAERVAGEAGPRLEVVEHGLRYGLDLTASPTSSGLFLDQRETRRRLLALDLRGQEVLNVFSHTGALSVAAATRGARTTSLDLSKAYLAWGRENLARNGLDPAAHDAIYGDAQDWLRRLERKGRRFDLVLLDPPSFSTTGRGKGSWSVERDLGGLVAQGARLVRPGGALYVSTNLRRLPAARFLERVREGVAAAGRTAEVTPASLPLDHRAGPGDPPYLKAAWLAL